MGKKKKEKKRTYLLARGPACTSCYGSLVIRHINGNLEYDHNYTNITAPPICIAFVSDALHRCLYNQANAALLRLYFFASLIGFKNCRGIIDIQSTNLSINTMDPTKISM